MWTLTEQHGESVSGRMGHASVYSQEAGLIYVQGGRGSRSSFKTDLFSYDPICGVWSSLRDPRYGSPIL